MDDPVIISFCCVLFYVRYDVSFTLAFCSAPVSDRFFHSFFLNLFLIFSVSPLGLCFVKKVCYLYFFFIRPLVAGCDEAGRGPENWYGDENPFSDAPDGGWNHFSCASHSHNSPPFLGQWPRELWSERAQKKGTCKNKTKIARPCLLRRRTTTFAV